MCTQKQGKCKIKPIKKEKCSSRSVGAQAKSRIAVDQLTETYAESEVTLIVEHDAEESAEGSYGKS